MFQRPFIDTNVVLYAFEEPGSKVEIAHAWLAVGGVISVRVLNECANVLLKKKQVPWLVILDSLRRARVNCDVVDVTLRTHDLAMSVAERHKLSVYDATIIAAALIAGCDVLFTEDMHNGLAIDGLTIRNPFAS